MKAFLNWLVSHLPFLRKLGREDWQPEDKP
jgi:hypothetical protein